MSGTASPTPARIPLNRVPLARSSYRTTPDFYSPASVSHILCYLPRALQSIITNRPRSASNMRTAWRIQATVHAVLLIRWVLCSGREGHRVLPRFRIAFAIAIAISRKTAQSVLGELSRNDDLKQRVVVRSFGDVGRKKGKKKELKLHTTSKTGVLVSGSVFPNIHSNHRHNISIVFRSSVMESVELLSRAWHYFFSSVIRICFRFVRCIYVRFLTWVSRTVVKEWVFNHGANDLYERQIRARYFRERFDTWYFVVKYIGVLESSLNVSIDLSKWSKREPRSFNHR